MTIVIFIKAPVAGRVKTRLCSALSPNEAADLYRAMAQDTVATVLSVPEARVLVAYEPHVDFPEPAWLGCTAQWFPQEGASLGDRLENATLESYRRHGEPVLVIGSDLPGLLPELLVKAGSFLLSHDAVLGPASDGGYYLIGLKSPNLEIFRKIPWSSPAVYEATLKNMRQERLSYATLPVMHDLDTPEDLKRLRASPAELSHHFHHTREALYACDAI